VSITAKNIVIMMSPQSNHTLEILQNPASDRHSLIRQIKFYYIHILKYYSVIMKLVTIICMLEQKKV